jgi:hypothetical protein
MTHKQFKNECSKLGIRVYKIWFERGAFRIQFCYGLGNNTITTEKTVAYYADNLLQVFNQNFLN